MAGGPITDTERASIANRHLEEANAKIEKLLTALREIERISSATSRLVQNLNACTNVASAAIAKATE